MQELGKAIEGLLRSVGIDKPVLQNKALFLWKEVVGETVAKQTVVLEVKHGILVVRVSTPVWRNELAMRKREILKKLNKALGKSVIKDIKLI